MESMTPTSLSPMGNDPRQPTEQTLVTGDPNETTSRPQRAANAKTEKKLSEGLKMSKQGGHLPTSYKLDNGTIVTHR